MGWKRYILERKLFQALGMVALLALFVFWQPRFLFAPLQQALQIVSWPVQSIFSRAAFHIRDAGVLLTSIGDLRHENDRLVEENAHLQAESARWQSVALENDELREQLKLLPRDRFDLISAAVIGRDRAGLGNWLTIDQGTAQGVKPGMPVIVSGSVLVGRVSEAYPESARVMLLTNPDSLVNGITVTGSAQGIVKGEYGLGIVYGMILQNDTVQDADQVVTSGLGGGFPKNLLVGTLRDVRPSEDHLYQQATIVSPVNGEMLHFVFVIRNSPPPSP